MCNLERRCIIGVLPDRKPATVAAWLAAHPEITVVSPDRGAAAARLPGRPPDVVIPPRLFAVPSTADPDKQSPRDRHVQLMAEHGRMAWQRMTSYGRRNAAETTMARSGHLIGPRLRARNAAAQAGEVALAIHVLNRMVREAKPATMRRRRSTARRAAAAAIRPMHHRR